MGVSGISEFLVSRRAVLTVGLVAIFIAVIHALRPLLPLPWRIAGSDVLYTVGIVGAVLLLVPATYSMIKRGENDSAPRLWLAAHIVAGVLGVVLITVHSAGQWTRAPAMLVLLAYFLVVQGAWARSIGAAKLAQVMASRSAALMTPKAVDRDALRALLDAKQALLARLDPMAAEAMFSPARAHWLRHPVLSLAYVRLAHREAVMIGARGTVGSDLGNWRRLHMAGAALLTMGIAIHVVTVTFFAGYVADGGKITWWHLAAWGG